MNIRTKLNRWLVQKLPVIALAALLAGCGPDEWIVWAPDGEHAIVRDGTSRIIDSAGNAVPMAIGERESIKDYAKKAPSAMEVKNHHDDLMKVAQVNILLAQMTPSYAPVKVRIL